MSEISAASFFIFNFIIDLSMEEPIILSTWVEEHKASFRPPICNKLMHKNDLSVMFVGGPNSRTDFHIDESSEFFFQIRGNMNLPIIEQGKRKIVHIKEGQVFLLPSRVPHSPQRPEADSLGLVIERKRLTESEFDALRWYTDFDTCETVQYEQFFVCNDLGTDLVSVVQDYKKFMAETGGKDFERSKHPLIVDDVDSVVPAPFDLNDWLDTHSSSLDSGATISLFEDDHPEKKFRVFISSETRFRIDASSFEVLVYQARNTANLQCQDRIVRLDESACFVLPRGSTWTLSPDSIDSRTLVTSSKIDGYLNNRL